MAQMKPCELTLQTGASRKRAGKNEIKKEKETKNALKRDFF